MVGRIGAAVAAILVLTLVAIAVVRVGTHEDHEVRQAERHTLRSRAGEASSTPESARLLEVHLYREQEVVFEVCSSDRMEPEDWADQLAFAIWRPGAQELMSRTEMTAGVLENAARDETHACLVLGRGVIGTEDDYAIEALWEGERPASLEDLELTLRVQAKTPLSTLDRALVLGSLLASLLLVLLLLTQKRGDPSAPGGKSPELDEWQAAQAEARPGLRIAPEARAAIGLAIVLGAYLLSPYFGAGAALGLVGGVALAGVETATAFGLAQGRGLVGRLRRLGLVRPSYAYLWVPGAVLAGYALMWVARLSTRLVPSTGRSAIQSFVSMPSGMLSFACLAVVAPLAEELFFRGLLYGELEKRSRALAFLAAWLLFALAHGAQTWGQWGALVAITVTGLGLTTLRATSRSTLVPAIAHLVYNGTIALNAVV